jgi:TetR/AcrR family transcriptional regulator
MARRYDPEATREDILNAAERVFADKGFSRASTQEVAAAAKVSQSQIHYHFGTKEALWEAAQHRAFKDYYQVQVDILTRAVAPGENRLEQSIEAYFRFFQTHPSFARMLMHNLLEGGDLGGDQGEHLSRLGVAVVRAEQEAGTLRDDVEPSFVVLAFLGLVSYWFMGRCAFMPKFGLEGRPEDWDETYLDNVKKVLLRGFLADSSPLTDSEDSD